MIKYIATERATIERASQLLATRLDGIPIWVRWYRTYDNPHGGGPFGKSKEYCTVELIGTTPKRLRVKDYDGVHVVDPDNCSFATRESI